MLTPPEPAEPPPLPAVCWGERLGQEGLAARVGPGDEEIEVEVIGLAEAW